MIDGNDMVESCKHGGTVRWKRHALSSFAGTVQNGSIFCCTSAKIMADIAKRELHKCKKDGRVQNFY